MIDNLIECPACNGKKTIIGLGWKTRECSYCNGSGHIFNGSDLYNKKIIIKDHGNDGKPPFKTWK